MSTRPVPRLTPPLMRLAAKLLESASGHFANHGCNDVDLSQIEGLEEKAARVRLDAAYHAWNGDPQEHDPDIVTKWGTDFALMALLAAVLREEAGRVLPLDPPIVEP